MWRWSSSGIPWWSLAASREKLDRASARRALALPADAPVVGLLPGSRRAEIRHTLPLQLEVARRIHARDPQVHFVLPRAASIRSEMLDTEIREAGLPSLLPLAVVERRAHEVLCAADVALCMPGTATLEAALLGCPMVVAARTTRLTSALVRRLVRVDSLAMPNLIAGERVVPEFYQKDADPERVADALLGLLEGAERERQIERFSAVQAALSRGGAARRAAEIASEMIVARLTA
jgi:lipid-A-disaccharide synthase